MSWKSFPRPRRWCKPHRRGPGRLALWGRGWGWGGPSGRLCRCRGTAGAARQAFPAKVNVAVALSLAGIGVDRTQVEVWADPTVTRNTHNIRVDADSASFSMTIENVPSENPRTGRIAALSLIACLRKAHAPLAVGT